MSGNPTWKGRRGPVPLADLAGSIMDPVLTRQAGMGTALIAAWPEIVETRLAATTRPLRLAWPYRGRGEDEPFRPATLIVAASPASALILQHQTGELLSRLDAFFGYRAVEGIKIVQNAVAKEPPDRKVPRRPLSGEERKRVEAMVANVTDGRLRRALTQFAEATLSRRPRD